MTPSHPLVEHIAVLRKRPGTRQAFRSDVSFDDLAITTARLLADERVMVDLTLESIAEGVVASGTITYAWEGECRRCLASVRGEESAPVKEIFATHPIEGETWPLGPDSIDLEPIVRETVLLTLPLAPLCDQACAGPVPEQFPAKVEGQDGDRASDGSDRPAKDPRWSALDQLEFDQ